MIKIFSMPIKVTEDCIDMMKHTNNKVYLKWMEDAALAHTTALGWGVKRYLDAKGAFVTRKHWIQYLRPTFLGEELIMYTWVEALEESTTLRRFQLMRNGKACMRGATEWGFINTETGHSIPIFPEVRSIFTAVPRDDPDLLALKIRVHPVCRDLI